MRTRQNNFLKTEEFDQHKSHTRYHRILFLFLFFRNKIIVRDKFLVQARGVLADGLW